MLMSASVLTKLPGSPGCFICDNNDSNGRSLKLQLLWDDRTKTVCIPCEPDATWCGFDNVVHGGLIATVLDEAMAWAIKASTGEWSFTAEYRIRYKKPVVPGKAYMATANVTDSSRHKIDVQAQFLDAEGAVLAEATGTFLPAKGQARTRTE